MLSAAGRVRVGIIAAALALLAQPALVAADATGAPAAPGGQQDFDWMIGNWKADLKRLVKPLTGSKTWVEFEGTQITRSVWGGRGTMDEFSVDSPGDQDAASKGFTLRLYNPANHDSGASTGPMPKNGSLDIPPTVGRFKDGRGEFYDQEYFEGRAIFVRYVWSDITASQLTSSSRSRRTAARPGSRTGSPTSGGRGIRLSAASAPQVLYSSAPGDTAEPTRCRRSSIHSLRAICACAIAS